ncbi:hypothetical protein TTRE_0000111501 [Trichuris trichiura]|uniref:Uncharacterized protein n=1 Tax=Trichuris trichiura TaxID=36087 RepID=A0A077YZF3_TRITR|nr:hypothetical protein TTRE_0000111501 [Trichuris trichiura]
MHVRLAVAVWIGIVLAFAACKTEDCEFVRIVKPSVNGGPTLVRCLKLLRRNSEIDYLLKQNRNSNAAVTTDSVCRKRCHAGRLARLETIQNVVLLPREDLILIGRRRNRKSNWEAIEKTFHDIISTFQNKKHKLAIVSKTIEPLCIRYNKEKAPSALSYYQCKDSRPWKAFLCECDVEITCEIEKPCTYRHLGDICEPAAYKWPSAAAGVCPALQCTCNPCEATQWTSWVQTATCGPAISYRLRPENRSVETSCGLENITRSSACCTQLVNINLGSCNEKESRRHKRQGGNNTAAAGSENKGGENAATPPQEKTDPPAQPDQNPPPPAEPSDTDETQTDTDTGVDSGKAKKSKPKPPEKQEEGALSSCDNKR